MSNKDGMRLCEESPKLQSKKSLAKYHVNGNLKSSHMFLSHLHVKKAPGFGETRPL